MANEEEEVVLLRTGRRTTLLPTRIDVPYPLAFCRWPGERRNT